MFQWRNLVEGDELRAADLHALLEQGLLGPPDAHGVTRLDLGALRVERGRLRVGRVAGWTPGHLPVLIGGPHPSAQPAVEGEASACFDAWVRVDAPGREERLSLETQACVAAAPPPALLQDRLYLGRYSTEASGVRLVSRPLCARLDGVRGGGLSAADMLGPGWLTWTAPLYELLQAWAVRANDQGVLPGFLALLVPLHERWAELDVRSLERGLRALGRGWAQGEGRNAFRWPELAEPWSPPDADGEAQIHRLLAHCGLLPPAPNEWRWNLGTSLPVLEGRWVGGGLEVACVSDRRLPPGRLVLRLEREPTEPRALVDGLIAALRASPDRGDWRVEIDVVRPALTRGATVRLVGLPSAGRPSIDFQME